MRRNVGTLRRIAVLAPLLGLLGTLFAVGACSGRRSHGRPPGLDPAASGVGAVRLAEPRSRGARCVAAALTPLSAGIIIATLALVAYDGLLTRIEKLAGSLDRLGAETIDAIALTAPISAPDALFAPVLAPSPGPTSIVRARDDRSDSTVGSGQRETGP